MWNKCLQEVIGKLNTTLCEMPPVNRAHVIDCIHKQLISNDPINSTRTLTNPNHDWILPPGNLQ
jgi:hypothetical protein